MNGNKVPLVNLENRDLCPYNPSHYILPHRMASHLIKCQKHHSDVKIKICPFNATHHVREENIHGHIRDCKDKVIVEREIFRSDEPDTTRIDCSNSLKEEIININDNIGESWDTGDNSATYDPLKNALFLENTGRPPTGLGKSTKKHWREVDYERIRLLKEGKSILDLMYPTPDGGGISIYKMLNGKEKGEESEPDVNRLNLRSPPVKPPATVLPKLRVPHIFETKIVAKTKEIQESEKDLYVDNGISDMDHMSDVSSVGSRSVNSGSQIYPSHHMNFSKSLKSKKGVEPEESEVKMPPPQLNGIRQGAIPKATSRKTASKNGFIKRKK